MYGCVASCIDVYFISLDRSKYAVRKFIVNHAFVWVSVVCVYDTETLKQSAETAKPFSKSKITSASAQFHIIKCGERCEPMSNLNEILESFVSTLCYFCNYIQTNMHTHTHLKYAYLSRAYTVSARQSSCTVVNEIYTKRNAAMISVF